MPPATRKSTVLLTGFGPFPGVPVNASSELARELASTAVGKLPGVEVVSASLPTEWELGPIELRRLIAEVRPDIALHFGVSERARGFEIEARAKNRCGAGVDAAGQLLEASALLDGAADTRPAGIDARQVVEELRRAALPAFLSRDAGGYLCNAIFFHSLGHATAPVYGHQAGFIHIPANLAGARRWPARPCMPLSWNEAVEGGLVILAACLRRRPISAFIG